MIRLTLTLWVALLGSSAQAQSIADDYGTKNPEELSLKGAIERLKYGETHPMEFALGYAAAKSGAYDDAKRIFEGAVEKMNSVQAMSWLAWMADNGLAGPEDPEAAAEWDRRAAALGSEVAMFNYGLDLLRGRGVKQNDALGQKMVRSAASLGDTTAQHLIDNEFDVDSVTPDADDWKYNPKLY